VELSEWINPTYLDEEIIEQMRRQFEHESCIELKVRNFFEIFDFFCCIQIVNKENMKYVSIIIF
jgi:hypothetical protein